MNSYAESCADATTEDFSSFAVVRFIGRSAGDVNVSDHDKDLQRRIWNKVRGSTRVDDALEGRTQTALPSYAQPEILQFIDCKSTQAWISRANR